MRRSRKSKIISAIVIVVLIVTMVITVIPAIAFAAPADGATGSKSSVVAVKTSAAGTRSTSRSKTKAAKTASDASASSKKVIGQGISIEGTDVSGMTRKQAQQVVDAYVAQYDNASFTLTTDAGQVNATAKDLGLKARNEDVAKKALSYGSNGNLLERYAACHRGKNNQRDIKISLTVDPSKTSEFLTANEASLETPAVNNGLSHASGTFAYVKGTEGSALDISRSVSKIADFVSGKWDKGDAQIALVTNTVEPKGTEKELSVVKDLLGTYTTDFSGSASGRITNIKTGTGILNGHILYPGEELSVYDTVSPMDADHGWAIAGAYENGTTVDSYGGGICQVSTTLYNAVIRAELEVVKRYPHSMVVHYVDPSMDAAIAGTAKNFVFKNNQKYPVYIEGGVSGTQVTFSIYGKETRDKNRKVSFESEVTSETDPEVEYKTSDEYPAGSYQKTQNPHQGCEARLWKIVTVDGKEVSRDIFNRSKYKAANTIYTVGTQGMPAEGISAVKAAIATGDENTIKATAAQWTPEAVAARAAQDQAAAAAQAAPAPDATQAVPTQDASQPTADAAQ